MNGFSLRFNLVIALATMLLSASPGMADEFDLTGTVLSGTNPYSFTHPELGTVTLTYSGSYKNDGLTTNWAGITSIGLGELAGTGILTFAWDNPVTSLDVRYYDLDLSEIVSFTLPSNVDLTLLADNPLDGGDYLDGQTLRSSSGSVSNPNASNYALLQLSGDPFTSFTASFQRPGGDGGSSLSIGNPVPEPASLVLFAGGVAMFFRRRRP